MKNLSTLICRVTKEKMDESNPPMMLPNGQVFCKNAIDMLEKEGKITCPIT
jgi:macrophage erythroblast attacher